jgi:hypothetical protein
MALQLLQQLAHLLLLELLELRLRLRLLRRRQRLLLHLLMQRLLLDYNLLLHLLHEQLPLVQQLQLRAHLTHMTWHVSASVNCRVLLVRMLRGGRERSARAASRV